MLTQPSVRLGALDPVRDLTYITDTVAGFLAAGMAKMKPLYIIPAFTVGKVISDTIAVVTGKYAAENADDLIHGMVSWKSISGLVLGLVLIFALLFIDWRTLLQKKKLLSLMWAVAMVTCCGL